MKRTRKKKGFWDERINCEIEVRKFLKESKMTRVPTHSEFWAEANIPSKALSMLGGREGISRMTGLPVKNNEDREAKVPLEKWDGKPSKAFEIEAEARKQGLCYADIQKQKTLEMVGGVKI